jgi:SAM-dependent methyltransferase
MRACASRSTSAPAPAVADYWSTSGTARAEDLSLAERQRKFAALFSGATGVVDLGCGTGQFLKLLRDAGVPAVGVDTSGAACRTCVAAGLRVVQADALEYLRRGRTPLGGVFSAGLLEHLDRASVESLLAHAARRLSPGALFVAVLPNPASILAHLQLFHEDPTHVRFYPTRYLAALCRSVGLEVVDIAEDTETLAGWGGRFTANFAQLAPLARRDPSLGILVRVVEDLASHFNAVIDQFVRPLEFSVVARKPA